MKPFFAGLLYISFITLSCQPDVDSTTTSMLVDENATAETRALFNNLNQMRLEYILFGAQDALAYGVHWKREPGRSDAMDVAGSHPAVYGWEIGHIEHGNEVNLDGVRFSEMIGWIKEGYERGGVITISWHADNPVSGGSAWDTTPAVSSILPGGKHHSMFNEWLDRVGEFLRQLQSDNGEMIPVIFRPWHEMNGSWFWWGRELCSPEEFHRLYRYTVKYLRDHLEINHLLYAYSPDRFSDEEDYLERYPGDKYVDILGYDDYGSLICAERRDVFVRQLETVVRIAEERNKIPALTESGFNALPDSTWYTQVYLPGLLATDVTRRIAYAQVWRNANAKTDHPNHFYVPYKGHPAASDFIQFRNHPVILFEDDLPLRLYD
ncbi:glycosyl hydrolase [Balneolaceae bacterium ANBcel3]|nr:glycosyl hydrolase [Balneolaceae bacterium ANBcel3]